MTDNKFGETAEAERAAWASRLRLSPAEFAVQLGARGITMTAVKGDLHITPADLLTEADLTLLRTHKADFIAAAMSKVTVI